VAEKHTKYANSKVWIQFMCFVERTLKTAFLKQNSLAMVETRFCLTCRQGVIRPGLRRHVYKLPHYGSPSPTQVECLSYPYQAYLFTSTFLNEVYIQLFVTI